MAETKKRPHADDAEQSLPKKRAVSEEKHYANPVNGVASTDEPRDGEHLEMFRKDAIYRRMKYYSREYERSEARVAELERRRSSCEASLAALEACWIQIIGTIRLLVKPDDLPPGGVQSEELFDLTARVSNDTDPQYIESLRGKMHATTELVSAIVRLGGQTQAKVMQDEDYRTRQQAQTEESSLRAELSLARTKLYDMKAERDEYRDQLVATEKRLDRLQSNMVNATHNPPLNGTVKQTLSPEAAASPAPPPPEDGVSGGMATPQEWEAIALFRSSELSKVRKENEQLRQRYGQLCAQIQGATEEVVTASPFYQMLQEQNERLEAARREDQQIITGLREDIRQWEESRNQLVTTTTAASEQAITELKTMLAKRDVDNARLREQRDQQAAELLERKQKENVKWQSLNEYRQLSESRFERIQLLQSEVTRLRSHLAARAGDEDLMLFILRGYSEELSEYVDDLKERLRIAERRAVTLEATLSEQQSARAGDLTLEIETRERLASAERELEKYRSVYGDASMLSADVVPLLERLQQKERELERLGLQLKQQQETESTIYAELDRLSTAWESLDKQLQNKVFDLCTMEEKLSKSITDRAKSDHKYYAAMRGKEASESERKQLLRRCDNQVKVIDKHVETESKQQAQIIAADKELSKIRTVNALLENTDRKRRADLESLQARAQAQKISYDKAALSLREQVEAISRERDQLSLAEEAALKAKKEVERQSAKLKLVSQNQNTSSSTREVQLQREVDQCMSILKCSTCRQNMRNTVITKCMHSFCKSCVDARIATRQRKCPACNLAFSQGEVQTLFFQ